MRDTLALLARTCLPFLLRIPNNYDFFSTLIEVFWYDIFRSESQSFGVKKNNLKMFHVYRKRSKNKILIYEMKLHSFWEKFQSCTNKKPLTANLLLFSIHKLLRFCQRISSLGFLPLYASYIIQCFFMFRILFFYKRLLSRPSRVSHCRTGCVVFFSSLTNLIIFAWLLIYSFSFVFSVHFFFRGGCYNILSRSLSFCYAFFSFIFAFPFTISWETFFGWEKKYDFNFSTTRVSSSFSHFSLNFLFINYNFKIRWCWWSPFHHQRRRGKNSNLKLLGENQLYEPPWRANKKKLRLSNMRRNCYLFFMMKHHLKLYYNEIIIFAVEMIFVFFRLLARW